MNLDISDETLTAYLDGELSEKEVADIDGVLSQDSVLADRLASLDVPLMHLKPAFDAILADAPAPELPAAVPTAVTPKPRLAIAAALVAGIGLGILWPGLSTSNAPPDWKKAVADYQVLYVPETLAMAAPASDAIEAQLSDLSAVLGRDLAEARTADGLQFRRGQILGLDGEPLIQLAYVSDSAAPFAICITPVDEADYAPKAEQLSGLASAHWVKDGYGFLVIGGEDLDFVEAVAESLAPVI